MNLTIMIKNNNDNKFKSGKLEKFFNCKQQ